MPSKIFEFNIFYGHLMGNVLAGLMFYFFCFTYLEDGRSRDHQSCPQGNPDAKIIAISGGGRNFPEDYLVLADHFGADRTFIKPVEHAELMAAARELLD